MFVYVDKCKVLKHLHTCMEHFKFKKLNIEKKKVIGITNMNI